jgi:MFS superfamily sulfate permease-like transporter
MSILPGLAQFRGYRRDWLRGDVVAGLTVARVEWVLLNAEANVEVDLTALDAVDQLRAELERRGMVFAMARVKQDFAIRLRPRAWSRDRRGSDLPDAADRRRGVSSAYLWGR